MSKKTKNPELAELRLEVACLRSKLRAFEKAEGFDKGDLVYFDEYGLVHRRPPTSTTSSLFSTAHPMSEAKPVASEPEELLDASLEMARAATRPGQLHHFTSLCHRPARGAKS